MSLPARGCCSRSGSTGIEVSAFAFVSDATVVPLAAARDYKRLGNGDSGPNTGGMGAFAPVPWFGRDAIERAAAEVFEPIAWRMARDGTPYRGVLYAGLMLTADGPMVLEFNARFGDPEAQVLLPLLDGELSAALLGCAIGDRSLMEGSVRLAMAWPSAWSSPRRATPSAPLTGRVLEGAEPSSAADDGEVLCFHAGDAATAGWHGRDDRRPGGHARRPWASVADARDAAYRGVDDVGARRGPYRGATSARYMSTIGRSSATRPGERGTGRTSSVASSIEPPPGRRSRRAPPSSRGTAHR